MTHFASTRFWACYHRLSADERALADKQFGLLKENAGHPSLQLKKVGRYRSARIGRGLRALAVESGQDLVWFWIGDHQEYERLIRRG